MLCSLLLVERLALFVEHGYTLDDGVDEGFGAYGATGCIDIHRDCLVNASEDVVAIVEHAASASADSAGDNDLRFNHLIVYFLNDMDVLLVHAAGDQEDVGVLGIAGVDDAKPLGVIARAQSSQDLDVAAVAARCIVMDDPR